jgi:aldehyde dehydrogenase (NAD+)
MAIDVQQLLLDQQLHFQTGVTKDVNFRKKQLKKLKSILQAHEKEMNEAIYADFKKSSFDTFSNELALVYLDIQEAISKLAGWSRRKRVGTNLLNFPARSYVYPEPLGSCLIIGAWNYPIQLSFAPVVAAIAAGNTVVLKPSEVPSNTSALIAKMVNENFDKQFFQVIEGGVEETTGLLQLKWNKIFFTGSVPVGKIVYQAAAKNLVPVTLELGGKSPAFVTKDCNLDLAVRRIVWGKFLNAGQTCIAPDYILVHQSVKERFTEKLIERIKEMKFSFDNDNYVQIINEKNVNRLSQLLDQEKVIYGGKIDRDSRFFEPTIMDKVTFDDEVMQDEIFGPILPLITYSDLSTAIQQVKALPHPLSLYIFSNQKQIKLRIINELSFGGGAVNDTIMHITNSKLPFGGVGNSGIGSYHGKSGFDTFTHYKSILDKATWLDPDLKYPPYTQSKIKWVKRLLGV